MISVALNKRLLLSVSYDIEVFYIKENCSKEFKYIVD